MSDEKIRIKPAGLVYSAHTTGNEKLKNIVVRVQRRLFRRVQFSAKGQLSSSPPPPPPRVNLRISAEPEKQCVAAMGICMLTERISWPECNMAILSQDVLGRLRNEQVSEPHQSRIFTFFYDVDFAVYKLFWFCVEHFN